MLKKYRGYIVSLLIILTMALIGISDTSLIVAHGQNSSPSVGTTITGSAEAVTSSLVYRHTINMQTVPPAKITSFHTPTVKNRPLLTGVSASAYAQLKAAAAHNSAAPVATHILSNTDTILPDTPPTITKFNGMADSPSICPPIGCEPPDMAVAASTQWVFQGVNTSFAVYDTKGNLQSGWPKTSQDFFGIPNPGNCDPNGAYVTDPRAFYDYVDGRFWVAMLQLQGGFVDRCPPLSLYWVGVSQTSDPNGAWNMYAFDMLLGTQYIADYTQFGFNSTSVYFSVNMYNKTGYVYKYAQVLAANKALMEAGSPVTAKGFRKLKVGTTLVDTVQPVETLAKGQDAPGAELLISSFDTTSGGGECSQGCSGLVVWSFTNADEKNQSLTQVSVSTPEYILAPQADEPGCSQCIETLDTRITGTPVYQSGFITFALETGVNNGTQVVPGIFWGEVQPTLDQNGKITGATLLQDSILAFQGDQAASFGCTMINKGGSVLMVFDTMSNSLNPSIMYTVHKKSDAPGMLENPKFLIKGLQPTNNDRWGDFEATSYDGAGKNHVWFASEYAGENQDWASYIGEAQL
ncbi:MAG TPA: hypothetical protein VKV20_04655 [Ktedonobacteraceae bacterium]|jgi:hypothetical protein|nr:hypothetical protein [Ktedonobacteraceae bacterium]